MTTNEINNYVSILSGIGTFVSSVIALFALKEVMKQRRAMYQPKLYLNEFILGVKGNPFLADKSFYHFHLGNLHEAINKEDTSGYSVMAQFFFENIGYGVASKIKYEWSFDYIKAIQQICQLDPDLDYRIDKSEKSIIITKNQKYYSSYTFKDLNKIKGIDFIKPESLQKNIKSTSIPIVITGLLMDYVMTKNKMFTEKCGWFEAENYENFPTPKLTISYEDIAEKRYETAYNFKLLCSNSFNQIRDDMTINTREEFAMISFRIN